MEIYASNPFFVVLPSMIANSGTSNSGVTVSNDGNIIITGSIAVGSSSNNTDYIVSDFSRIAKLSVQGLNILAHSIHTLDKEKGGSIRINTQEFCERVYGGYNETLRTRVRRGIKNLILNAIIAYSDDKDIYWLNSQVIWR